MARRLTTLEKQGSKVVAINLMVLSESRMQSSDSNRNGWCDVYLNPLQHTLSHALSGNIGEGLTVVWREKR